MPVIWPIYLAIFPFLVFLISCLGYIKLLLVIQIAPLLIKLNFTKSAIYH